MGGLSRILLRSLGLQEGCTQRLVMHSFLPSLLFHTAKGGFLIPLLQRRGTALSALHKVAPECSASLHSLHICTSSLLPQSCVFQPPWAISLCR